MTQNLPINVRRKLRHLRWYRYRFIHYILPELLAGVAIFFSIFLLLPILAAFLV